MEPPPVQYLSTGDGYDIAYTVMGSGPPLVLSPTPFGNVSNDWHWWKRSLLEALAERFTVVHYNSRGHGMSSRGLDESFAIDDYVLDLEAVVERTGIDRFVLVGLPLFGHVFARYACRHPHRVRALVLHNVGAGRPWEGAERYEAMARESWDVFMHTFAATYNVFPNRDPENISAASQGLNQQDFLTVIRASRNSPPLLDFAPDVQAPTLVVVTADIPGWVDGGRRLAAAIKDCRLTVFERYGRDLLSDGDGPPPIVPLLEEFLAGLPALAWQPARPGLPRDTGLLAPDATSRLTDRETEVLRLIAEGRSNQEIASALVLSVRTVERHISNVYGKIGARRRADATAYALRHGLA